MIFTDANQPAFPDPWDLPTLSTTPVITDALNDEESSRQEPATATTSQQSPHSGWREMLADIQHGLLWGLEH